MGQIVLLTVPKVLRKILTYTHTRHLSIYLCTTATGRTSKVVTVSLHALTPSLLCMHVHYILWSKLQTIEILWLLSHQHLDIFTSKRAVLRAGFIMGPENCRLAKLVCALFTSENLPAGAVKGLLTLFHSTSGSGAVCWIHGAFAFQAQRVYFTLGFQSK